MINTKLAINKLSYALAGKIKHDKPAINHSKKMFNNVYAITKDRNLSNLSLLHSMLDNSLLSSEGIIEAFELNREDVDIMNIVTPKINETDERYMTRILESKNYDALIIKLVYYMLEVKYDPHNMKYIKYLETIKDVL